MIRRLLCRLDGHRYRQSEYAVTTSATGVVTERRVRQTCLRCGADLS